MPELKPCPHCGSVNCRLIEREMTAYGVCDFKGCWMSGPIKEYADSAIAAWNQLPRALTWTHEPPVVAGWYWMRQQGEIFDLIQHYNQADIDGGFDNERRLKQWSGPIPEPKEPT